MKTPHSSRAKIDRGSFKLLDTDPNVKVAAAIVPSSTILVAEPTLELAEALADLIVTLGYGVEFAATETAALEKIQSFYPILVIVDIHLPELGGFHLCETLKANPNTHDIPVIFMGDAIDPPTRDRVFLAGAVDYILKPFSVPEVLIRIRNQLRLINLHRRLVDQQLRQSDPSTRTMPLLASLQKRLREQSQSLQEQNSLLQHEILERQQIETALREEQQKSQQLLLNILPAAIAEKLIQGEDTCAERFEEATILFADIVNFTPVSAKLHPLKLVKLLNEIFSAFDRLAESFGLEKIKTIGDAYMVAGGVPLPRSDHAEAIMEMAIAMRREIRKFRGELSKPLQLRIGINTGTVVAGVIGLKKFSYDLWGDAVNVASRMESQGLPGKIQVTEATYLRLKDKYLFEEWGTVNVKGKGEMITYLVIGRR
jgi:class 3 adenylate cyclase/AmiR/NasT family two-component response regulator